MDDVLEVKSIAQDMVDQRLRSMTDDPPVPIQKPGGRRGELNRAVLFGGAFSDAGVDKTTKEIYEHWFGKGDKK